MLVTTTLLAVLLPLGSRAEESKFKFAGDIRGRGEGFRFSADETGSKKERRWRMRYRLRLNMTATVNEYADVKVRLGTGASDSRSGNVTLGGGPDFGPDAFSVRRAYLTLSPFKGGDFEGGRLMFEFGRVPNPFLWKNGEDKMLWDSDINLAGFSTIFSMGVGQSGNLFASTGYYVLEEISGDKDPMLAAIQAGVLGTIGGLEGGVRGTYYRFDRLTAEFVQRGVDGTDGATSSAGNIQDGLTGNPMGGQMNVLEGQAFAEAFGDGTWPLVAFGGYSHNASATASAALPDVGADPDAFNVGVHVGDKGEVVKVGASYYYIEANAFPSQLIDSDILDGVTNRKGATAFVAKRVMTNADLQVTVLNSDAIKTDPGYFGSATDSERWRTQIDLSYKF
jgi:hypothetical protein